jgi:hypothetical protein
MRDYEPEGTDKFQYFHLKGKELAFPLPPVRRLCDWTKRTHTQNTTRNFKYKRTKTKERCSWYGTDMTALMSTAKDFRNMPRNILVIFTVFQHITYLVHDLTCPKDFIMNP